jgi:two-component system autoinducer 1 sensor kinase/phosphatase LuxN
MNNITYELLELEKQKARTYKILAGSIAHDLRNPLYQIMLLLPRLKENNKQVIENISQIIHDTFTNIDLIMLLFNEQKLPEKYIEKTSITKLIESTLSSYDARPLDRAKIMVKGDDFEITTAPMLIDRVLKNLIDNALYYSKADPELTIAVKLHAKSQQITVEDTGPGIDPEILPKIFDACFTHKKQEGTGIGLAFCREAMKSLDGAISCESEIGKYTAFTLTF